MYGWHLFISNKLFFTILVNAANHKYFKFQRLIKFCKFIDLLNYSDDMIIFTKIFETVFECLRPGSVTLTNRMARNYNIIKMLILV